METFYVYWVASRYEYGKQRGDYRLVKEDDDSLMRQWWMDEVRMRLMYVRCGVVSSGVDGGDGKYEVHQRSAKRGGKRRSIAGNNKVVGES